MLILREGCLLRRARVVAHREFVSAKIATTGALPAHAVDMQVFSVLLSGVNENWVDEEAAALCCPPPVKSMSRLLMTPTNGNDRDRAIASWMSLSPSLKSPSCGGGATYSSSR